MEFEATKTQVVEALKRNGNYDELKAKLRASVFQALQGSLKPTSNLEKTQEDRDIVYMIQDFCRLKNLPQTSAILEAEWGSREENIKINRSDQNHPYLAMLLKSYFEPKAVGVSKARVVPPPPSAPKVNAPIVPVTQDTFDSAQSVAHSAQPPITTPESSTESDAAKPDVLVSKNALNPIQTVPIPNIFIAKPSPDIKVLTVKVDEAIASHTHDHIDTPSVNVPVDLEKPSRQRYRSSDIGDVVLNKANRDLMNFDGEESMEEVISSDRSAVDPKKGMENVDQFEVFSLEDITEGSDIVRDRTLTKEDDQLEK